MHPERFPASVSVSLLLTHGRSGSLFLTHHKENDSWGLIAGGVEKNENPWDSFVREAWEEAHISGKNIIFVRGRDSFEPHVALIKGKDKTRIGLVYSATYSGPKIPLDGWDIEGDDSVDRVELFSWQRVLSLLDGNPVLYRSEFNHPQLVRWLLKDHVGSLSSKRVAIIDAWLSDRTETIPGLSRRENQEGSVSTKLSDRWDYIPPYNDWMNIPNIRGNQRQTNFARHRFAQKQ